MFKEPLHTTHPYKGVLNYKNEGGYRLTVEIDEELANYYRSLIPKYFPYLKPRWPSHITVVRTEKETPVNREHWGKYHGQEIEFQYDPIIRSGKMYYWLNIWCVELENIREELGLPVVSMFTLPPAGYTKCFHCTIANMKFEE
jgi:hypothetical protein